MWASAGTYERSFRLGLLYSAFCTLVFPQRSSLEHSDFRNVFGCWKVPLALVPCIAVAIVSLSVLWHKWQATYSYDFINRILEEQHFPHNIRYSTLYPSRRLVSRWDFFSSKGLRLWNRASKLLLELFWKKKKNTIKKKKQCIVQKFKHCKPLLVVYSC